MHHDRPLIYYITAHGYGHGVRSCDIIRAIRRTAPKLPIRVITDLPVDFLRSRLDLPADAFRAGAFDVGMVQLDSIRVDVPQTLARAEDLLARRPSLIAAERAFLRAQRAGCVVCDIPAIPIEAAKAEGIPALAVGNFAWDWIYEDFIDGDPRWASVVAAFRDAYRQADLLLRLPFSEPMAAFPNQRTMPIVSTAGRDRRAEMAHANGIDPAKTWVLLSFTSLDWDAEALRRVQALSDYEFLTVRPLAWTGPNLHAIDRQVFPFADVIATADIVVSKPGYGILSECAINDKPLVYAERENFREYPILEAALKRHLRHVHLPAADLYRGDLQASLAEARSAPAAIEPVRSGGDQLAADAIGGYV